MTTKLNSAFKRELQLNGQKYTLTVAPAGFKLVEKGKRKGIELGWTSIVNGDAALASALTASIASQSKPHERPQRRAADPTHTKH